MVLQTPVTPSSMLCAEIGVSTNERGSNRGERTPANLPNFILPAAREGAYESLRRSCRPLSEVLAYGSETERGLWSSSADLLCSLPTVGPDRVPAMV